MFHVRDATMADLNRLVAFSLALAEKTAGRQLCRNTVTAGVQRLLNDRSLGFILVAETRRGRVIGELMVGGREWDEWSNGEFWWITSLCVLPSWMGKGVERALYSRAEKIAQQSAVSVLGLRACVLTTNQWAREVLAPAVGSNWNGYLVFESRLGVESSGVGAEPGAAADSGA